MLPCASTFEFSVCRNVALYAVSRLDAVVDIIIMLSVSKHDVKLAITMITGAFFSRLRVRLFSFDGDVAPLFPLHVLGVRKGCLISPRGGVDVRCSFFAGRSALVCIFTILSIAALGMLVTLCDYLASTKRLPFCPSTSSFMLPVWRGVDAEQSLLTSPAERRRKRSRYCICTFVDRRLHPLKPVAPHRNIVPTSPLLESPFLHRIPRAFALFQRQPSPSDEAGTFRTANTLDAS